MPRWSADCFPEPVVNETDGLSLLAALLKPNEEGFFPLGTVLRDDT